ncbi:MAG TPA: hypothetical protein VIL64_02580 [Solirubrobacteraceae bacterium]
MPTFAADPDAELDRQEVDRRTREAWGAYRAALHDLEGRAYEEAEPAAWDRLQDRLSELAR